VTEVAKLNANFTEIYENDEAVKGQGWTDETIMGAYAAIEGLNEVNNIISVASSRTLGLPDFTVPPKYAECSSGSAIALTIPSNATAPIPIGSEIDIEQVDVGAVSFIAASGVTIRGSSLGLIIDGQYAVVTLKKVAINTWRIIGAVKVT